MFDQVYSAAVELAAGGTPPVGTGGTPSTTTDIKISPPAGIPGTDVKLDTIILSISNWALGITGTLAVLFLIIGGILYITAAGNQQQIDKAKKTIKGAIIGIVIILLSAVIVYSIGFLLRTQ